MPATRQSYMFDTVAIVGVGLIGGSLGMALSKRSLARRVVGIGRSEQKLMRAKILGAIDDYSLDLHGGASEADLLVICTPVRTVVPIIRQMAPHLKPGTIVTDVGSTKREIVEGAFQAVPDTCCFVGGHPMAGSEEAGVDAAFPDLFLGATYVLTPTDDTDLSALGRMTELVEAIGARLETMSPTQHDEAAAIISHLPHAVAASLLHLAAQNHEVFRLAAGSFRDLTRIADSPAELWRDICLSNAEPLIATIELFQEQLAQFRALLKSGDEAAIEAFFGNAGAIRDTYVRMTR